MIEQHFDNRQKAADAAATAIADRIRQRLDLEDDAALVVSGGSTPAPTFKALSAIPLDWAKVQVLPSDERWVAADAADSNEKMIRATLMTNQAASARFVPLYRAGITAKDACGPLQTSLENLPLPLAVSLLGMGADGHFASLFPDFDGLGPALDLDGQSWCVDVQTVASPHPRMSLTLAALTHSEEILLLFFGEEKMRVFEAAKNGDPDLPVTALLQQDRAPVRVVWAP
jgi:6-phosphogluconolactonase